MFFNLLQNGICGVLRQHASRGNEHHGQIHRVYWDLNVFAYQEAGLCDPKLYCAEFKNKATLI